MYGIVNKAFQALVYERFGEDKWEEIMQKSGVDIDIFIGMEQYPDEITFKIVGAASEVLEVSVEDFLKMMGEYWVTYTADGDYKDIFNMAGNTFVTFLQNLNTLHTRVGAIMLNLNPPSFTCTDISKNSLRLHYYSTRVGLSSMVIGLLKGLGNRFKMVVEVKQTAFKVQGDDHDEFLVKFYPTNPN